MNPEKQYVSATLGLYLKNKPEGHKDLTSENWNIGKEQKIPLSYLLALSARRIIDFYALVMPDSTEEINEQIRQAGDLIGTIMVREKPNAESV